MNILKWFQKSYHGEPQPFNKILLNKSNQRDITTFHDAVDKSLYVYACLDRNATKISNIEDNYAGKLSRYNRQFSWSEMLYSTYCWTKLAGYALFYYDRKDLWILDLSKVSYDTDHLTYDGQAISYQEVAVIRNQSPFLQAKGFPTLTDAVYMEINAQYKQTEAVTNFYEHGMFTQAYVTSDQSPERMNLDLIKEQLKSVYSGPKNAGSIPLFHSGLKIVPLALSPDQFKQLASDNVTMEKIAMMFGVPPLILGRSESGWGSKDPIYESWVSGTIIPTATSLAQQITDRLFPLIGERGTYEFNFNSLPEMQNILLNKAQKITLLYKDGLLTKNEARGMIDLEKVSGGDEFVQPKTNMMLSNEEGFQKSFDEDRKKAFQKSIRTSNKRRVDRFTKRFRKPWKSYMDGMRKDYLSKLKKAKTPEDALLIDFDDKFLKIGEDIGKEFLPDMYREAAEATMAAYPKKSLKKDALNIAYFNEADPFVMEKILNQIIKLSDEIYGNSRLLMEKKIRSILGEARNQGLGIKDTMDMITEKAEEELQGWSEYRSERIARTESTKANSMGSLEGARQNGMNAKAWLPSGSANPREEHAAMDPDHFIPLDAFFSVGGEAMYGPGEGSAEQVINCGCSLLYDYIGG